MCCAYEAAHQHTAGVGCWREGSRAAGTVRAEEDEDQTPHAAATASGKTHSSRTCWNCGTSHTPDRASCLAREAVCVACHKRGHFKRCCRSSKRPYGTASANAVSGSVTTAGANVSCQPTIEVTVALGKGAKHRTAPVTDTGAQVCVAGAALLSILHIQSTQLQGHAGLQDVADLPLRCLGSCWCNILSAAVLHSRSWCGFVNQLAPFLATAPILNVFRELLKKPCGKSVYWDEQLQEKFHHAQDTICQLAKDGLAYYDKTRLTVALTDWSREGIRFIILQQFCHCLSAITPFCCRAGWRLALCGSRHLTAAETGYAAVEREALVVVWCL
ncbi:hypothetical protein E2C01_065463 [Portunus trituberculatus]|uniref:Reverse transcriptase/retrotransposon-derived protein RNase H-like domain-containing protein n=1 Tax=Portunus trituberculatus TaxID=210409 RepID=A0A5B7HEM9_PORTR|nr:hypothetical protein [Portunus trituberculatus]